MRFDRRICVSEQARRYLDQCTSLSGRRLAFQGRISIVQSTMGHANRYQPREKMRYDPQGITAWHMPVCLMLAAVRENIGHHQAPRDLGRQCHSGAGLPATLTWWSPVAAWLNFSDAFRPADYIDWQACSTLRVRSRLSPCARFRPRRRSYKPSSSSIQECPINARVQTWAFHASPVQIRPRGRSSVAGTRTPPMFQVSSDMYIDRDFVAAPIARCARLEQCSPTRSQVASAEGPSWQDIFECRAMGQKPTLTKGETSASTKGPGQR